MVKVYTVSDCPWCDKVKKYLDSKGVDFEAINVEENPAGRKELMALSTSPGTPTTYFNGEFVLGFEKAEIDALLGLQKKRLMGEDIGNLRTAKAVWKNSQSTYNKRSV